METQTLIMKINSLPLLEKKEVGDFVDFLLFKIKKDTDNLEERYENTLIKDFETACNQLKVSIGNKSIRKPLALLLDEK